MKSTISQLKRGCRALFIDRRIPSAVLDRLASGTRLAARTRLAVTNQLYRLRYRFSIPIPPAELMHLVVGENNVRRFLAGGQQGVADMRLVLARQEVQLSAQSSVLDFGCGCGRVIRWMNEFCQDLHGSDYNSDLIDWCSQSLSFAEFRVNQLAPPLSYDHTTTRSLT